jgi:hypothetical protein
MARCAGAVGRRGDIQLLVVIDGRGRRAAALRSVAKA